MFEPRDTRVWDFSAEKHDLAAEQRDSTPTLRPPPLPSEAVHQAGPAAQAARPVRPARPGPKRVRRLRGAVTEVDATVHHGDPRREE